VFAVCYCKCTKGIICNMFVINCFYWSYSSPCYSLTSLIIVYVIVCIGGDSSGNELW